MALARAESLTTAIALALALVLVGSVLGAQLLSIPFLQEAVAAGRVLPAPLAGCGALVVATDWGESETVGARSVVGLLAVRWVAGGAVVLAAAYLIAASMAVVAVLFLVLGMLATLLPGHWWLALPALLYLQLYVPADLLLG